MAPVVDGIAREYAGRVRIVRIDVNDPDSRALMNRYRFPGTPYLIFENAAGVIVFRRGGARAVDSVRADVEALLQTL